MSGSIGVARDALWEVVEALLPTVEPASTGRPRVPDRTAFGAIMYVLFTGIAWKQLPRELGVSGSHGPRALQRLDPSRSVRSSARRAAGPPQRRGAHRLVYRGHRRQPHSCSSRGLDRPSPVDRGRTGSKHHLICDSAGVPLAVSLTGGQRNDVTQLLALIDAIGPVAGRPGRPRQRPDRLLADRGYDHDKYRRELWRPGVKPVIARRQTDHGSHLARFAGSSSAPSPG